MALVLGAGLSIQTGVNASLRSVLGHPLHATIVSFLVGTVALLGLALATGLRPPPIATLSRASIWMYLGGIIGAIYVGGTVVLAPRLGAATLMALIVTGQLVAAVVIDHFGWLGFPAHSISLARIIGGGLLIAGVVLVRRG
jgi:transporter family-2 protein